MTDPNPTSPTPFGTDGRAPHAIDGVLVALAAAAVYLSLGQDTLYYTDGHHLLERLRDPELPTFRHHLGVALDRLAAHLGERVGLPAHRAVTTLAALGTATGVGLSHLAFGRLGLSRRECLLAAVWVAAVPPALLFATLVEFHGLFFSFSQLCLLAAVGLIRRPSGPRAVGLGLAAALATFVHASGLLLTVGTGAFVAGCRWRAPGPGRRRILGLGLLALAVHAATVAAGLLAVRATGVGGTPLHGADVTWQTVFGVVAWVAHTPTRVWEEWLEPYLPLSVFCLLAVRRGELRPPLVALLVAVAAYLALCVLILVLPEHGAYLMPVAALAAPLAVRAVPAWLAVVSIVLGLALGTAQVTGRDDQGPAYREFTAGVRAASPGTEPLLLAVMPLEPFVREGGVDEVAACLVADPAIHYLGLTHWGQTPPEELAPRLVHLPALLRAHAAGREPILLSAGAIARLEDRRQSPSGHLVVAALREHFAFEAVRVPGFSGYRLVSR